MNYQIISFHKEEHYIRKFLELPGRLYSKKEIMQQPEEERNILEETHVLSHRFRIFPLLVLNQHDTPVSRCILTIRKLFWAFLKARTYRKPLFYC